MPLAPTLAASLVTSSSAWHCRWRACSAGQGPPRPARSDPRHQSEGDRSWLVLRWGPSVCRAPARWPRDCSYRPSDSSPCVTSPSISESRTPTAAAPQAYATSAVTATSAACGAAICFRRGKPRSAVGRTGAVTEKLMNCVDAWRMTQRRATDLGACVRIGCQTFRAAGITPYLEAGGTLETRKRWQLTKTRARRSFTIAPPTKSRSMR